MKYRLLSAFDPTLFIQVALGFVAGTSLASVLVGPAVWSFAALGASLAWISLFIGRVMRLLPAEIAAVSLVLFSLAGGFVAGGLTPDFLAFFDSVISGWADLLSSVPPVYADSHYRVLPFALGWLGATGGVVVGQLRKTPALGALVPLAIFGVGLLFSIEVQRLALAQGAALTIGTLALGWLQQRRYGFEDDATIGMTTLQRRRGRIASAALLLFAIAAAAPFGAPHMPGLAQRDRFDIRDSLIPPWNALNEPSPLAQMKANYRDTSKNDVVFVISGTNIPRRWKLASLGVFDGEVWTVGDIYVEGRAPFVPIDTELPVDPQWANSTQDFANAARQPLAIEVRNSTWPWLPMPLNPVAIISNSPKGSVRFNAVSRTAALPQGSNGFKYQVHAVVRTEPSDEQISTATFPFPSGLGLSQQASNVRDWSADLVESQDRGWPQIEAIQKDLRRRKYLSGDGAAPGHSWGRLQSFFGGDDVYGFEEQYAAAAAIAARNAELNVRVVVGYIIEADKLATGQGTERKIEVTRDEASAWIEVLTEEYGWVQFDVTPDRDQAPTFEKQGKRTETVAAPNPPPPPPPPSQYDLEQQDVEIEHEDEEEEEEQEEEEEEDNERAFAAPNAMIIGGAIGFPFSLIAAWSLAIVAIKSVRKRKRQKQKRPADRIRGAWLEVNDRLVEAGNVGRVDESVGERSKSVPAEIYEEMATLAQNVSAAAFAPEEPSEKAASDAWNNYRQIDARLQSSASWLERLRRRVRIAPLRREVTP